MFWHMYKLGFLGVGLCLGFAIINQLVEAFCPDNEWLRYLGVHGLYHIGMSSGFYIISQFFVFIYADNENYTAYFKFYNTGSNLLNTFLELFIPIVNYAECVR